MIIYPLKLSKTGDHLDNFSWFQEPSVPHRNCAFPISASQSRAGLLQSIDHPLGLGGNALSILRGQQLSVTAFGFVTMVVPSKLQVVSHVAGGFPCFFPYAKSVTMSSAAR